MLAHFNTPWHDVPICVLDSETTGVRPGYDKIVSLGLARFERGQFVGGFSTLVKCDIPIPAEATAVHGITDADLVGRPSISEVMESARPKELLADAQPGAFNCAFDRQFIPPFGADWTWPWLDALPIVRVIDRYQKGKGRHCLGACCKRHGITLTDAHDALADARAAGELLFKIGLEFFPKGYTLGQALGWCRRAEAVEWFRFNDWLSKQPPMEK